MDILLKPPHSVCKSPGDRSTSARSWDVLSFSWLGNHHFSTPPSAEPEDTGAEGVSRPRRRGAVEEDLCVSERSVPEGQPLTRLSTGIRWAIRGREAEPVLGPFFPWLALGGLWPAKTGKARHEVTKSA